jgi:hypothetical protein
MKKNFLLFITIILGVIFLSQFKNNWFVLAISDDNKIKENKKERILVQRTQYENVSIPTPSMTPKPILCGGIEGKICDSGYQCVYSDGSTRPPSVDAIGNCLINLPKEIVQTEIPLPVNGTEDFCQSMLISKNTLSSGETLTMTLKAKTSDIATFGFAFYNKDNGNNPIMFTPNKQYSIGHNLTIASDSYTLRLYFSNIDKPDKNWNYYMPKPKNIEVYGFFRHINGKYSKWDKNCSVSFTASTIDSTPTSNSACLCTTAGVCSTSCFYNKFINPTGFNYSTLIKCNFGSNTYTEAPSSTHKNKWCQFYYKTKGDADGDGKVTFKDYFYFISAIYGAKLPPLINVDFDGDGYITNISDRAIIIKSLKQ